MIAAQRDYLLRYALLHLRNPAQAEDAVQETLLAAMEGAARWGNPAAALEDSRFRAAFELCLQRLPARTAQAFAMREVMEVAAMIPSCKEISELLSRGQDRPLRWSKRVRLRMHLLLCDGCRNFRDQLEFLRTALRRYRDGP